MKLSAGSVGAAVVVVIVISGITMTLLGHKSQQRPARAVHASTADSPSATTSKKVPKSVSNAPGTRTAKVQAPSTKQVVGNPEDALAQATVFLQRYYLILPDDTEAARKARIAPYVTKYLLARIPVGLGEGTAANDARVRDRLVQHGRAVLAQKVVASAKNSVVLSLPVVVTIKRPNGKWVNRLKIVTNSKWSYAKGRWLLSSFQEGGDSG